MTRKFAPHKRQHREDYYLLAPIYRYPGLTNRKLARIIGADYESNFQRRAPRLARWLTSLEVAHRTKIKGRVYWHPTPGLTLDEARLMWRQKVEGEA